jgi:nuclear pore complex protein Nup53
MWGHILEHRIPSQVYKLWQPLSLEFVVFLLFHFYFRSQGNWMHLKFASRLQARKALARNGRLLTDTLIIGVVPCTDGVIHTITRRKDNFDV